MATGHSLAHSASPLPAGPEHFINRELSILAFNARVLSLAGNPDLPILERLRFLCIVSTNLDEFFEVRISQAKRLVERGAGAPGADGMMPCEIVDRAGETAHALVERQYALFNDVLAPSLRKAGILFPRFGDLLPLEQARLLAWFRKEVAPVLTPIAVPPGEGCPAVPNKGLHALVSLRGFDAFEQPAVRAIVRVPNELPPLLRIDTRRHEGTARFIALSSLLEAFLPELFDGAEVTACHWFRLTRNSDLRIEPSQTSDIVRTLEDKLAASAFGTPVRLELSNGCPDEQVRDLLAAFALTDTDLYRVSGPVDLNRLRAACESRETPGLRYPQLAPGLPAVQQPACDLFATMRREPILLHHPYESFQPVVDLFALASQDPQVVAIKITLYRTDPESLIVSHLIAAALAGKEVTAIVELRARFDEAANMRMASRLRSNGVQVCHGPLSHKTHCKMALIVRREKSGIRRYVHLGTGNYHAGNARAYTDYGLLSADAELCQDVHRIFLQLTGMMATPPLSKLAQAPFDLCAHFLDLIDSEASRARDGRPARIIAKINALVDPHLVRALYRASQSGVRIDLIVRGMCSLKPGIPGISENIRVRSIVGRFLEHSRVFYFFADGEERVYCASADWMERNMRERIEICFPIEDDRLRSRLIENLELSLADNVDAWLLAADGDYRRAGRAKGEKSVSSQQSLIERLGGRAAKNCDAG
jgi:polyphosphate kinase